jgi:hypothetical protein
MPSFQLAKIMIDQRVFIPLLDYFGCGTVRPDSSDKTLKYEVRCICDLVEKLFHILRLIH